MGESLKSKVFVQIENAIIYIWLFSIAPYTEILSKAFQILLKQHDDQSFLLLTVPGQAETQPLGMEIFVFSLAFFLLLWTLPSDSGPVSKGVQWCSLEMKQKTHLKIFNFAYQILPYIMNNQELTT